MEESLNVIILYSNIEEEKNILNGLDLPITPN